MFTPLTSPKPIQNCHNFLGVHPFVAISEKHFSTPTKKAQHLPIEGGLPPRPFRSKQTKKERTEVLVKQLLKVSMENNTLEAEILAKVRGQSGMDLMVFPWVGPDSVEKNLGTCCSKNEEVSVFLGC